MNAQKESLKKLPGFMQALASPMKKVCDETERDKERKKRHAHKMLLIRRRKHFYRGTYKKQVKRLGQASGQRFWTQ